LKLIIAGGREVDDYEVVRQAVIESGYWKQYKRDLEIVCGMALYWLWDEDPVAGGVDRWGYEFAKRNNLTVHKFCPDWKKHGKAAGHIRNAEMGKFALEHEGALLAVWNGKSTGTKGMIDWAREHGLEGFIYRTDKPARYVPVGTEVTTTYSGKTTKHLITEKIKSKGSQSGVLFNVSPMVPKSYGPLDADWFSLV
jgi:hypothetical protein